ncbi:MAG: hypothetical protein JSV56_03395, partial [Methanomassiliicoccales archaeon]
VYDAAIDSIQLETQIGMDDLELNSNFTWCFMTTNWVNETKDYSDDSSINLRGMPSNLRPVEGEDEELTTNTVPEGSVMISEGQEILGNSPSFICNVTLIPISSNGYAYTSENSLYQLFFKERSNAEALVKLGNVRPDGIDECNALVFQPKKMQYRDDLNESDILANVSDVPSYIGPSSIQWNESFEVGTSLTCLKYVVEVDRLKEFLILNELPRAPDDILNPTNITLDYGFKIAFGDNIIWAEGEKKTADFVTTGAIEFRNSVGEIQYTMPEPFAVDSNNMITACSYRFDFKEEGALLYIMTPYEWLADEDRAYPVTIDPTTIASSGTGNGDGVVWGNQRVLVRDSKGYWYAFWQQYDTGAGQYWINASKSSNYYGSSWDSELYLVCDTSVGTSVLTGYGDDQGWSPCVAVYRTGTLSDDRIYLTWRGYDGSAYRLLNSTCTDLANFGSSSSWTTPTYYGTGGASAYNPSITVDESGIPHVVWRYSQVYYTKWVAGSGWATPIAISGGSNWAVERPAIDIDLDNNLHVAWLNQTGGNNRINYKLCDNIASSLTASEWHKANGNPGVDVVLSTSISPYDHTMVVDNAKNVWVVARVGDLSLYWNKMSGGSWGSEIQITSSMCYNPSIGASCDEIDGADYVHLVWEDATSNDIYYAYNFNDGNGWDYADYDDDSASESEILVGTYMYPSMERHIFDTHAGFIARDDTAGEIIFAWQPLPKLIDPDLTLSSATRTVPALVRDSSGYWYTIWRRSNNNGYHVRSANAEGTHWEKSPQKAIAGGGDISGGTADESPCVAIFRTGTVANDVIHVVWMDGNEIFHCSLTNPANWETGWGSKTQLDDGVGNCNAPQIVVDGNGVPHAIWREYNSTSGGYDVFYTKQVSGTWQTGISVTPGGYSNNRPCIDIDSNNYLHIAYENESASPDKIVYKMCDNPGSSLSANEWHKADGTPGDDTIIDGSGNMEAPSIVADADNDVWVVCWDQSDRDIWYVKCDYPSSYWGADGIIAVSGAPSFYYPTIGADSGGWVHVVWESSITSNFYYSRNKDDGTGWTVWGAPYVNVTDQFSSKYSGNLEKHALDGSTIIGLLFISGTYSNLYFDSKPACIPEFQDFMIPCISLLVISIIIKRKRRFQSVSGKIIGAGLPQENVSEGAVKMNKQEI